MNLAFLTLEYPPGGGGIATSIQNLARELVRRGHRVAVVGWGPLDDRVDQGVAVHFLGESRVPKAGWWLNRRRVESWLRERSRRHELDVVVAHDWCGPSWSLRPGCPVAVICHGTATYFGDLLGEPVRWSVRHAEQGALRRADGVAAVSRFCAERTRRLFALGEVPCFVPNGVDVDRFEVSNPAEVDPDLVLYFGTLVRKKGVLDLCRAFAGVLRRRPSARLVLIGRDAPDRCGPSTWAICRREMDEQTAKRVEYLGFVPYAEMHGWVRRAACCVFPSYAEALPLAWLETLACGVPLVGYDIGWAGEVLTSGEQGFLVPSGNLEQLAARVADVLEDPKLRERLGRAARERAVAAFSQPVAAAQFERWATEVVQRSRSAKRVRV